MLIGFTLLWDVCIIRKNKVVILKVFFLSIVIYQIVFEMLEPSYIIIEKEIDLKDLYRFILRETCTAPILKNTPLKTPTERQIIFTKAPSKCHAVKFLRFPVS